MCGICGFISEKTVKDTDHIVEMWKKNESRGGHAHGWGTPTKHHKAEGPIPQEIALPKEKLMILHTRFTTHGSAQNNENNHPHVWGPWTIIHNGVLRSLNYGKQRSECDSEQIAKALLTLNKVANPVESIKRMQKEIDGSYRIAILNKHYGDHLWLVNDGESIKLALDSIRNILYFASETKDLPKGLFYSKTDSYSINEFRWSQRKLQWEKYPLERPVITVQHWMTEHQVCDYETAICEDCQRIFHRLKQAHIKRTLCGMCASAAVRGWALGV